jgi:LysR family nitrogen assimilation transcriptional regulator
MNLRQLRYFVAIADAGSFTSAALVLHVAQSALSRHMKLLEDTLGGELFERGTRGVVLTESGQALLTEARMVLARVEDIRTDISAMHGEVRGTVKLAMPSSLSHLLCVPMVHHFFDVMPGITLQLSEGTSQDLLGRIRDATIDVGIVTECPPDKYLNIEVLGHEPLVLMGLACDPLMQNRTMVEPALLPTLPLIMANGVKVMLGELSSAVKPVVYVETITIAKALIFAGRGYAVVPASSACNSTESDSFAARPITGMQLTRMVVTSAGRPVGRATREVIRYLRQNAEKYMGGSTA